VASIGAQASGLGPQAGGPNEYIRQGLRYIPFSGQATAKRLVKRLERLGYQVALQPQTGAVAA
jgi:hypothetical protein